MDKQHKMRIFHIDTIIAINDFVNGKLSAVGETVFSEDELEKYLASVENLVVSLLSNGFVEEPLPSGIYNFYHRTVLDVHGI